MLLQEQNQYRCSKNFQKDYNHFHNILGLFDVLPNFPFTTSETMRDYYLSPRHFRRWGGLGAHTRKKKKDLGSQEIRKKQESIQTSQNDSLLPSLPAKMKNFLILAKIFRKIAIQLFLQCAISHENQSQSQIFCDRLQSI